MDNKRGDLLRFFRGGLVSGCNIYAVILKLRRSKELKAEAAGIGIALREWGRVEKGWCFLRRGRDTE